MHSRGNVNLFILLGSHNKPKSSVYVLHESICANDRCRNKHSFGAWRAMQYSLLLLPSQESVMWLSMSNSARLAWLSFLHSLLFMCVRCTLCYLQAFHLPERKALWLSSSSEFSFLFVNFTAFWTLRKLLIFSIRKWAHILYKLSQYTVFVC